MYHNSETAQKLTESMGRRIFQDQRLKQEEGRKQIEVKVEGLLPQPFPPTRTEITSFKKKN